MSDQACVERAAFDRLSRAVWDSRVVPSKSDIQILLDARATDYEVLAEGYKAISGKDCHASDCATSNAPAERPGPCDCDLKSYCPGYCRHGEPHYGPCNETAHAGEVE